MFALLATRITISYQANANANSKEAILMEEPASRVFNPAWHVFLLVNVRPVLKDISLTKKNSVCNVSFHRAKSAYLLPNAKNVKRDFFSTDKKFASPKIHIKDRQSNCIKWVRLNNTRNSIS
jgi:hypothetical protein